MSQKTEATEFISAQGGSPGKAEENLDPVIEGGEVDEDLSGLSGPLRSYYDTVKASLRAPEGFDDFMAAAAALIEDSQKERAELNTGVKAVFASIQAKVRVPSRGQPPLWL